MLTTAIFLKTLPLVIVVGVVMLFPGVVNNYVGERVALLLIVAIVAHELYKFGVQIVSAELRVGETATLRLTYKLVWVVAGYAMLQYDLGIKSLIYGLILGYTVPFLWAMYKRSTPFRQPAMEHARSLVMYSKYNFLSAVSGYFYNWMDILVIGLFLTPAQVGAYEVAWRVTAVVTVGSTAIAHTIFPQISRWDADEAVKRIERLIPQAVTPSLIIAVPSFFGTLLFSREILTFVFDAEYSIAWLVLIILMAEKVLLSIHVITGRSLKATDHPDLAARAAVIAITANLTLNLVLVWQYGIIGAAVATVVSFGLNTLLCIRYLSRYLTIRLPWNEVVRVVAASLGMTLILFGIDSVIIVDTLLRLIVVIGFGVTIYSGFILLFPVLRTKVFESIQLVRSDKSPSESVQIND